MVTEELIKKHFVHDTISQGINHIYETQEKIVRTYLNTRSGGLVGYIQRKPFTSQQKENKLVYYMRILPYLRYLDIRYRKGSDRVSRHIRSNLALYNRTVWGVLYHETFPEIRYGFTEEIQSSIRRELEQALQNGQSQNK